MKRSALTRLERLEKGKSGRSGALAVPNPCTLEEWLARWQNYNHEERKPSIFIDDRRPL